MTCSECSFYRATRIEELGLCSQELDYSKRASLVDAERPACPMFLHLMEVMSQAEYASCSDAA